MRHFAALCVRWVPSGQILLFCCLVCSYWLYRRLQKQGNTSSLAAEIFHAPLSAFSLDAMTGGDEKAIANCAGFVNFGIQECVRASFQRNLMISPSSEAERVGFATRRHQSASACPGAGAVNFTARCSLFVIACWQRKHGNTSTRFLPSGNNPAMGTSFIYVFVSSPCWPARQARPRIPSRFMTMS